MAEGIFSNPISIPVETKNGSLLAEENRFICLPGCGLCCSYRVLLTEEDKQRLMAAGYVKKASELWETTANSGTALCRTPDFCLFLDPQQRCGAYDFRPEQCRTYPYLWTSYLRKELDVDLSCPGLGQGESTPLALHQILGEGSPRLSPLDVAIGEIHALLRSHGCYATPDALVAMGIQCIEELTKSWTSNRHRGTMSLYVSQLSPLLENAEKGDVATKLWSGFRVIPCSVEQLLADANFIGRHFSRPRWNTRLESDGSVVLYRFWILDGILHVKDRGETQREILLAEIEAIAWKAEALATRRAYLYRWLNRQLSLRLAYNMTVANLIQGSHTTLCYLEFILEIDHRLVVLASALARAGGKDEIDREVAIEAIRGSDGLLRAWCESARLGVTN